MNDSDIEFIAKEEITPTASTQDTSFSKYILFWKQNKTVFWGQMATNGRKRYFHIDENASSEQIHALLDDVESADEDDIENLMNDLRKKLHKQLVHETLPWLHQRLIFT